MFIFCEKPIRIRNPNAFDALKQPLVEVPCGQCILCRLKVRKEWTLRLRLEASLYDENLFVTLTYDPEHVPPEVQVRDIQLFIKRLRKNCKFKFRFYSVSEYGSHTQRPHFHVILFGYPLKKMELIKKSWNLGFVKVAPLTNERCNYTCGYTQKKYDKRSDMSLFSLFPYLSYQERLDLYLNCSDVLESEYHKKLDPRRSEFATCSLGIGLGYLLKFWKKITEEFSILFGGKRYSIPRYFRKKILEVDPKWNNDWKEKMGEYACESMIGLFDKSSKDYVEHSVEIGVLKIPIEYDGVVEENFRKYVEFRASNVKRSRELFKYKKNMEV